MRYDKGRKDATRQHIVEAAGRRFRKDGIDGVGLAGLMADAGLTHGAFYGHFDSKEALAAEAIDAAFAANTRYWSERLAAGEPLEALVRRYLTAAHRDHPELGCVAAALAGDAARRPPEGREAFARRTRELVGVIATALSGPDTDDGVDRAWGVFAVMMGALQLARAEPDPVRSEAILERGAAAALRLAR